MLQPDDDNCISTGKERKDRSDGQSINHRFDPLQIDVNCPDTAILLLSSRERPVLVAAAAALTKFASKGKENLQILFQLDVIDSLLPIIDHEDLFTRRFAMRLLAEMAAIPLVRNHLTESDCYLPRVTQSLTKDADVFVQEFATSILADISKDPYGVAKIFHHFANTDIFFEKIQSSDPDLKKNVVEIMNNSLKDPTAAQKIVASQAFSFPLIYQLFEQPYASIRSLAISIIDSLVLRSKDSRIHRLFRESNGPQVLLDLLNKPDFDDIHSNILKTFVHAAENGETAESLMTGGGVQKLFRYLENSVNLEDSRDALDVLVRLASSQSGRKMLHDLGLTKKFLEYLRKSSGDSELTGVSCRAIGIMARHGPAAEEIAKDNPVRLILDVLKDEKMKWSTRESAIYALKELCFNDNKNGENFMAIRGPAYLGQLLKLPIEIVPLEIQMGAVDVLNFLGENPMTRERLIEHELVQALSASFEAKDRAFDEMKMACCKALSRYCVDKRARELCNETDFVERLFRLLQDVESTPVRAAAVQLVQQLCTDFPMAERFVQAGYLNFMLKRRTVATILPTWNNCISALFAAHLPVKFAATGRLSLHDVTHDGFYVMRRHICPFPILDELFRLKMCPMEPVYVVNCAEPEFCHNDVKSRSSIECYKSIEAQKAWLELKFGKVQPDPHLCEYVTLFKCVLAANESDKTVDETRPGIVNISKIATRAKLLGKFVVRQMSGPEARIPCIDHQLDIHVREIRDDLETSVIPLGQLRVGSYLERALLFKVIADRICLPAALVRGEYGKAWIEIAIPEVRRPTDVLAENIQLEFTCPQIENTVGDMELSDLSNRRMTASRESLSRFQLRGETWKKSFDRPIVEREKTERLSVTRDNVKIVLPTRLLQENYIVDLMEKPGDLIPIRSARARAYCAPISHCAIDRCDL